MRGMQIGLAALILLLPAAGEAVAPEKPAAAIASPAKPAALTGSAAPAIKRVQMSQEGNAIITRINASPDARLQQIQTELRTLQQQNLQFVTGEPVNLDKLDASLRRELALITELRGRANDRLLMVLRALSESDRVAYLQRSVSAARVPNAPNQPKPPAGKTVVPNPPAAAPAIGR